MKLHLLAGSLRTVGLIGHLLYALPLAIIYPTLGPAARRTVARHWSGALLRILHIRLTVNGAPPSHGPQGALLVANHISWLDVFLINAVTPSTFIAKSEVRSWPLIGWLCQRARTLFVQRGKRADALLANQRMAERLVAGECVVLFPEGTTTSGGQAGSFHASLLQCAIDAECGVHPVAVSYHDGAGNRSDDAAYIGDMTLVASLLNVLFSKSLHATVAFLPAQATASQNRRELADAARAAINAVLADTTADTACAPATSSSTRLRVEA
jgi:1-acyl-sn-glycerol-3-phosphate acyltransferase